ncbi:MAG TPA: tetratricopeptide repeat protein [Candidatus Angelobacter sp.]|nr:tetratricopeptide repeat protein [Candidatus Angelobacter sp.]
MQKHWFVFVSVVAIFCSFAGAQEPQATQTGRLGKVSFPTSCSTEAQPIFDQGIALLHSFQYALANASFTQVLDKDPHCAMGYWGQAMILYHQLWDWPQKDTLAEGLSLMQKAARANAKTDRERDYIRAATTFFEGGAEKSKSDRVKAYSAAMADIYKKYPQDNDAAAFYALSLLSTRRDDKQEAGPQALAILKSLFAKEPDHPGAAHYLIHAADTPVFAPEGLAAARRYAQIAPDSAHALHMPAHIFTRLGMWQDSINSNLASARSAFAATKSRRDNESGYQLHAMHYLSYAYLQRGRNEEALKMVDGISEIPGIEPRNVANDGTVARALYLLETHQWQGFSQFSADRATNSFSRLRAYWALTIAQSHLGNVEGARASAEKLHQALAALRKENPESSPNNIWALGGEAWLAFAQGKTDEALSKMRSAVTAEEDDFSQDDYSLPAQELMGDLLLELHRPEPALTAYEASLKEAPNRFNSLYGAARAAELAGQSAKARTYYSALIKNADPLATRQEIQLAKTFLAENQSSGTTSLSGGQAKE